MSLQGEGWTGGKRGPLQPRAPGGPEGDSPQRGSPAPAEPARQRVGGASPGAWPAGPCGPLAPPTALPGPAHRAYPAPRAGAARLRRQLRPWPGSCCRCCRRRCWPPRAWPASCCSASPPATSGSRPPSRCCAGTGRGARGGERRGPSCAPGWAWVPGAGRRFRGDSVPEAQVREEPAGRTLRAPGTVRLQGPAGPGTHRAHQIGAQPRPGGQASVQGAPPFPEVPLSRGPGAGWGVGERGWSDVGIPGPASPSPAGFVGRGKAGHVCAWGGAEGAPGWPWQEGLSAKGLHQAGWAGRWAGWSPWWGEDCSGPFTPCPTSGSTACSLSLCRLESRPLGAGAGKWHLPAGCLFRSDLQGGGGRRAPQFCRPEGFIAQALRLVRAGWGPGFHILGVS